MKQFTECRSNGIITLPSSVDLVFNLNKALESEVIVISVPSQGFRSLLHEIRDSGWEYQSKTFILCMKGIEIESRKRLTEVFEEVLGVHEKLAVRLGPGHPQGFVNGIPNCMGIDSKNKDVKQKLVHLWNSPLVRFYIGNDLIGNEIGAAAKNVIGIAAGVLDGIGQSSLKGALMSRGTLEVSRLIDAMGGNPISAYGLCHLGDYEATVFSKHSHNRKFGESFARGEHFEALAEGYYTARALHLLSKEKTVDLPICNSVYEMLYEGLDIQIGIDRLFHRNLKTEF